MAGKKKEKRKSESAEHQESSTGGEEGEHRYAAAEEQSRHDAALPPHPQGAVEALLAQRGDQAGGIDVPQSNQFRFRRGQAPPFAPCGSRGANLATMALAERKPSTAALTMPPA